MLTGLLVALKRRATPQRVRVVLLSLVVLISLGAIAVALGSKKSIAVGLWLGGLVVAATIGVAIRPRSVQRAIGKLRPSKSPVEINVVPSHSVQRMGANWALPERVTDSELAGVNEVISTLRDSAQDSAVKAWVYRLGGADVGTTSLRLVFQGLDLPVALINIGARAIARTPVMEGTAIVVGVGGGGATISVYLDLDSPGSVSEYFRDNAITIGADETVVVDVYASCEHSSVEWDLLLDFVRSGEAQTLVLHSADHLLRTTGEPAGLEAARDRGEFFGEFGAYETVVYYARDRLERASPPATS